MQHVAQVGALLEVAVHHRAPAHFFFFVYFGKAVAGQVYQMKTAVDEKNVDQPRFARSGAGFAKLAAVAQRIDELAFAHVALADYRQLGQGNGRLFTVLIHTGDEFSGFDFHLLFPF